METLQAVTAGDDVIFATGVGQHQMWAMQYLLTERPRNFITSGGLGTMGYGIPAAIGAKAARPEATVVCVDGDGCFQMTAQELTTAVLDDLPIIVVLVNNGSLGMVTQWQDMFFDGRRSHVDLSGGVPDYVKLAEAYGGVGMLVESEEEFEPALREALALNRTVVIDCRVDPAEQCFPMIPAGAAAIDMVEYEEPVEAALVKHTISVLLEDKPGALARIATMFARRGFNIDSLAVGPTERDGVSCITLRVDCEHHTLEQIEKQIHKLVNVLRVTELAPGRCGRARAPAAQGERGARAPGRADLHLRGVQGPRRRPRRRLLVTFELTGRRRSSTPSRSSPARTASRSSSARAASASRAHRPRRPGASRR